MNLKVILRELDAEIARLKQAKRIIAGQVVSNSSVTPKRKKKVYSDEARRRIAEAQKKRWRKQRRAAKAT